MRLSRSGVALLAVALAGCDVPTEAPMVEQRWVLPMDNTSIAVKEFLPDGVTEAGEVFLVKVDPFSSEATLGELCPSCVNGTVTLPAFQGSFGESEDFPPDVISAVLAGGSVVVAVTNGFSFDPVAGGGDVVITLTDGVGGKVLGQTTISTAMPPGSTVVRGATLTEGPVSPTLLATVEVDSPGGQTATIDTNARLVVNVDPTSVQVGSATVDVAGQAVEFAPVDLDVGDIDKEISDRIESGVIIFEITNPLRVPVNAALVIDYPGGSLSKSVAIEATATSTTSVSYTGDELRLFMGQEGVTLSGTGTVPASANPILLRPGDELLLDATIDFTLVIG